MSQLTIVANIRAKPEHQEQVRTELEKLIPITRQEKGCLLYDLHQDDADPAHFMFYETWKSRELWQAHMDAPHLAAYMKATDGMVAEFTLHEMTKIA
jgi:quinol monooxygenase YgiN